MKADTDEQRTKPATPITINESKTTGERLVNSITGFVIGLIGAIGSTFLLSIEYNSEFGPRLVWIIAPIVLAVIFFIFAGKHKFTLNQEGVSIKSGIKNYLYRWDSFQYFTSDNDKKRFQLKRKSSGSLQLISREHFDEVKQILSEHIHPR
jgi:hypothetical protein